MNFLHRAFLSMTRRLDKSLLLFLIVFILSNVMAGSIAISQASENVELTMKQQLGANATVEIDYEKIQDWTEEQWQDMQWVTPEMVEEIGALSQVKYYDYNIENWLMGNDLKEYNPNNGYNQDYEAYFSVKGVHFPEILDIATGDADLVDGRVFTQAEVDNGESFALISDKFAELNNLHLGDLLLMSQSFLDQEGQEIRQDFMFEVIGIYSPNVDLEQNDDPNKWIDYTVFNRIYTTNGAVQEINDWQNAMYAQIYPDMVISNTIYIQPVFVLNDPEAVESFKVDALQYLPDYYKVRADADAYESVAGPINFIGSLSNMILWVAIFATILILSLVVVLFLRDRKHEFGIYLSLGEAKWKVLSQIVAEVFIVSFLAITLSMFSGTMIADMTSQSMIDMGVGMEDPSDGWIEPYYYYGNISQEDVINAYEVHFNLEYVLVLYGVGLSTVLVSTIAPMLYLLRLKPKKILM